MRTLPALVFALAIWTTAAHAQTISGTLLESRSRLPIRGGTVTLLTRNSAAVMQQQSDLSGTFSFQLREGGAYVLHAAGAGYLAARSPALNIGAHDTVQVEFSLAKDNVVLEPLVVTARSRRLSMGARDFYARAKQRSVGSFITRVEIDQARPLLTTELFNRLAGLNTRPIMGGNQVTVRGRCQPTVYLDGVQVHDLRSIDDIAPPSDLEGVEVYRDAHQAPPQYTGLGSGCAAILLWTRLE